MAATVRRPSRKPIFKEPKAAKAPAANSRLSPGRKGVITKPVSIKVFMILFESNFSDPYVVEKLPDQRLSIGKKP